MTYRERIVNQMVKYLDQGYKVKFRRLKLKSIKIVDQSFHYTVVKDRYKGTELIENTITQDWTVYQTTKVTEWLVLVNQEKLPYE